MLCFDKYISVSLAGWGLSLALPSGCVGRCSIDAQGAGLLDLWPKTLLWAEGRSDTSAQAASRLYAEANLIRGRQALLSGAVWWASLLALFLQRDTETTETQLPNVPISDSFGSGDKSALQSVGRPACPSNPSQSSSLHCHENRVTAPLPLPCSCLICWSSSGLRHVFRRGGKRDVRTGNLQQEDRRHCVSTLQYECAFIDYYVIWTLKDRWVVFFVRTFRHFPLKQTYVLHSEIYIS